MRSAHAIAVAVWLALVGSLTLVPAQTVDPPVPPVPEEVTDPSTQSMRLLLDAIRDHLVTLRFEQALAAIEALLGEPSLSETDRAEALVLRSQAHVAFGDLDAAEGDYREILRMRPGFVPDSSLTPKKAMERFRKARATTIGDLVVDIQPSDARVLVDGREMTIPPEARLPLVAGEHVVRGEREGFDPVQKTVQLEPNQDSRVELRLVPNARTVVLETEPEGVDVTLDGAWIGRTARAHDRAPSGSARQPARLRIDNLPLGEHVFELSKQCYRGESFRDLLTVDLLDWSPKLYPPVTLAPARSTIVLRGGPDGAAVYVDGQPMARLPAEPLEVCPGERRLVIRHGERRIWSRTAELDESQESVLEIDPRPNMVLLGAGDWPPELRKFAEGFNTSETSSMPQGDLSKPESWERLGFPDDADLAVARRTDVQDGSGWWLYSQTLRVAAPLDSIPTLERPSWGGVSWGLFLVDSERHGPALVAHVVADGPASRSGLRPGDRVISLGGSQVANAAQGRRILGVANAGAPLDAEWLSPDGTAHRGRLDGEPTVRLVVDASDTVVAMVRAAWAEVDAACDDMRAPAANANLALLLSAYRRDELAAQIWRRVDLPERAGIGRGTVLYHLGSQLERLGAEPEAIRFLRAAAASEATAFDDEGPLIAPAARDRLADLGVKE
jgi:hypothetical protein